MERRQLLQSAIATGGLVLSADSKAAKKDEPVATIIDSNVSLFHWPFRRLPLDESQLLVKKMRSLGVTGMFAGSFDGILHRDIAGVNQRLAAECQKFTELIPIGSVNPMVPGWQRDFRECHEKHKMPGIRLHPNYHGYGLSDPLFSDVLELAKQAGVFVQIMAVFEDNRTQAEMLQVADVDLTPLADLAEDRVQILNWRPRGDLLSKLSKNPNISFDTARIDSTDGVAKLLKVVPEARILFGTHAPFLIPEASLIRVHESFLKDHEVESILYSNAAQWVAA